MKVLVLVIASDNEPIPKLDIASWEKKGIPENTFHFRVKVKDGTKRVEEEIPIHAKLVKLFYK